MPATTKATAKTRLRQAIKNPPLDGTNAHFKSKYATLAAVLDVVRNACDETGLDFSQGVEPSHDDGAGYVMATRLWEGNEPIQSCLLPFKMPDDPQKAGSLITYLRRYGLCLVFGIVGDDDDDGNAAATTPPQQQRRSAPSRSTAKPPAGSDADARRMFWKAIYSAAEKAARRKLTDDDKPAIFDAVGEALRAYDCEKFDQLKPDQRQHALESALEAVGNLNFESAPDGLDDDPMPF